jgi:acyl dehydratase
MLGDTVHLELRVAEKKETSKPERGVVVFDTDVCNQDGRAVITGRWTLMMRRSPPPAAPAADSLGAEPVRAT